MQKRWYDDACGTALALEFVGERWSLLVIRELMFGPRRFGEIKTNLPGISANVLTQRLGSLEAASIVMRRRLPSPANVQVYDLTDWGREAEMAIREMGRWAARSPRHDPFAFMSTASAMISLRTFVDPAKALAQTMTVAFRFPDDAFVARLADGEIAVARGESNEVEATLVGDTMALRRTIYGKNGFDGGGLLSIAGDRNVAQRFVDLFALPTKIGA
ncbi:helix-turn-helix domain-containing protein [Sphingomonas bacterium]|uniref:winged helix-turn-helix transcriptional regulator n=1 Tax=Sphingomonas bacterium TaxID=1895847 RepID=UPI0026027C8B|nr:helix-turn-helix domain-containing protein [Sphingomonas bacterium]